MGISIFQNQILTQNKNPVMESSYYQGTAFGKYKSILFFFFHIMESGSTSSPFERMQSTSRDNLSGLPRWPDPMYPKAATSVPEDFHDKAGHDKLNILITRV